jgi:hypothetical protein
VNLRTRVESALPAGAFLRRDRGDALYVTDAPRLGFAGDVKGLRAEAAGGLLRFYIKEEILTACDFLPDCFALSLARLPKTPATGEALVLFTEGLKILEAPDAAGFVWYDKKVRQAAAVALRTDGGGGLYTCALVLAEIERRMAK